MSSPLEGLKKIMEKATRTIQQVHTLPTLNVVIKQGADGTIVDLMDEGGSNALLKDAAAGTAEWEFLDEIPEGGMKTGQAVIITGKMLPSAQMVAVGREIIELGKEVNGGRNPN